MLRSTTPWRLVALMTLALVAPTGVARAANDPSDDAKKDAGSAPAGAATAPAATPSSAPIDEQLRQQAATLQQLQDLLVKQQAEIERLKEQLDAVRSTATAPAAAVTAATGTTNFPAATTTTPGASAPVAAAPQDDSLAKKVDNLDKLWGNLKLTGDVRIRNENFWNQGFDGASDANARNRFRMRVRAQLSSKIDNHFDWAIRLASGSFDDPTSTNQTFDNFYDRKPIAIDRAFLHFTTDTKPANLDVYAGKFDAPWRHTSLTFDPDVQPEGFYERLKVPTKGAGPLASVSFQAWQLPIKERSIGADAYIFGGQILTEWAWSKNWASTVSGTFHDFEQVDVIPPLTGVSPTLVNAGLEIATTNTVVTNPFTGLPEYRSEFRAIDGIADLTYKGWGDRRPLTLVAEFLHNTSAFNNQRDGGYAALQFGRTKEEGDYNFNYNFYKAEREVFPSVFMESDVTIQTNALAHWLGAGYMLRKNVQLQGTYWLTRRLQTTAPENRWLSRFQLDMIYSF